MAIVTGDRYLDALVKFVEVQSSALLDGTLVLKLNPVGLHYVQSRIEQLQELESLLAGAPIDYLRAYISDLGDHRALEQLRRILRLLTSLKVVSVLPQPARDPTPISLLPFGRLRILELRGCDLSSSAARGLLELRHTLEKIICHNSTVSCPIVKLVLRNNALTTLRGIENLKSVEGLDLSYNIISNFSELELLGSLPSLKNLWLEGNPVCCSRWYRAQVFSFFTHPEKLTFDERGMSTRETWKRQIILAGRQKQPAGYGFYSPAKEESEEGSFNTTRRKLTRLAFIEDEAQRSFFGSESADQESVSCDSSGYPRRDENAISDGEAEIVGLMNKVEFMKKERSVLWLREFREWMDQNSEDRADDSKFTVLSPVKEKYRKNRKGHKHLGESSRYVPDSAQDSGDESSTNVLESDISFTDTSIGFSGRDYFDSIGKTTLESSMMDGSQEAKPVLQIARMESEQEQPKAPHEELNLLPSADTFTVQGSDGMERKVSVTSLTAINEIMESRSSSIHHGSPPHYQEDLLHRRHNLEEEFLQLSAESFSLASSDSDTSSDDDSCKFWTSFPGADRPLNRDSMNRSMGSDRNVLHFEGRYNDMRHEKPDTRENGRSLLYCAEPASSVEVLKPDIFKPFRPDSTLNDVGGDIIGDISSQDVDCLEKKEGKRKPRRRIVSLSEENLMQGNVELLSQKLNGVLELGEVSMDDRLEQLIFNKNSFRNSYDTDKKQAWKNEVKNLPICPTLATDEFIKNYFHENVADSRVSESCLQYMRCDCILHRASGHVEIEVGVLWSSESKLYILLIDGLLDGTANISKVVECHRVEDIKEVVFGIGLQVLRVHIKGDASYLFITRTIEKSRRLLCLLQVCDSSDTSNRCSVRSWEQVQVKLFEDQICEGLEPSIFQYSMLLFWHDNGNGESWLLRSLFVIEGYVLVCIEDLVHFSSRTDDVGVSSPYFSLDSCCPICGIVEMVIEPRESRCVTLSLNHAASRKINFLPDLGKKKQFEQLTSAPLTWKLKWFSEDAVLKFVSLIKAIHLGVNMSPLPICTEHQMKMSTVVFFSISTFQYTRSMVSPPKSTYHLNEFFFFPFSFLFVL
ncbi:uncharacterized protein LOC131251515 isoform X3 [Magnolia sinica]|uniref:uncharacterized protein LOC131251515 isoform X3 n=1 Tax=Magnolia sinica TaxID=86752 RepID=UPI00265ADB5D|nr:uncharacterized protein LOC131251515 isoform X3 [Magnolia sinica]